MLFCFFFKQKTAYEMRISDWSSDVCSSDLLPGRHVINLGMLAGILGLIAYFLVDQSPWVFWTVTALSFLIGFLLIIPIGGADMPVVVSMLNSYSGWAAAAMGFTLQNTAMIITGAPVGSRSEEHTSELQSLMRISYAVFCLKK